MMLRDAYADFYDRNPGVVISETDDFEDEVARMLRAAQQEHGEG